MGAKGITPRIRKFNEQNGSGKSREAWEREHVGAHGNAGAVGLFDANGNNISTYLGETDEGGVRVRKSALEDASSITYVTNNDWTGPQMFKDMSTLVEQSGANSLKYINQDGKEFILEIKQGADRAKIAKALNSKYNILKKNNRTSMLTKNKTMASWSKQLKSGDHKGQYKITINPNKPTYLSTKPTTAQMEKMWKEKISRQTTNSFTKKERSNWDNLGLRLYRSK